MHLKDCEKTHSKMQFIMGVPDHVLCVQPQEVNITCLPSSISSLSQLFLFGFEGGYYVSLSGLELTM